MLSCGFRALEETEAWLSLREAHVSSCLGSLSASVQEFVLGSEAACVQSRTRACSKSQGSVLSACCQVNKNRPVGAGIRTSTPSWPDPAHLHHSPSWPLFPRAPPRIWRSLILKSNAGAVCASPTSVCFFPPEVPSLAGLCLGDAPHLLRWRGLQALTKLDIFMLAGSNPSVGPSGRTRVGPA